MCGQHHSSESAASSDPGGEQQEDEDVGVPLQELEDFAGPWILNTVTGCVHTALWRVQNVIVGHWRADPLRPYASITSNGKLTRAFTALRRAVILVVWQWARVPDVC